MGSRWKFVAVMVLASTLAVAGKKTDTAHVIDSGSYGIFVNGKRVGTETFHIQQGAGVNVIRSELRVEEGQHASQKSELQISPAGELRRYQWNELSPGRAQTVVEPDQQFLIERITLEPKQKPQEQPYMMPATTLILDDYFFTHRQVLAWRYLAAGCKVQADKTECRLPKQQFGAIVPRQHASMMVSMEHAGLEKVTIRGQERQLNRFNLSSEGLDWALWLDENYKLIRIVISAENTEVVRD